MAEQIVSEAIASAMQRVAQHPQVSAVRPSSPLDEGQLAYDVDIIINLPNKWRAAGEAPTGVRAFETVTLIFYADFPYSAPKVNLRSDFNRALPHIQPGEPDGPVEPCYLEGNAREFLQQRGIDGILNQVVTWLHNAARNELIDHRQGWEPIRRDALEDVLTGDLDVLRDLVRRREHLAFLDVAYIKIPVKTSTKGYVLQGVIDGQERPLNLKRVEELSERRATNEALNFGTSVAVIASSGSDATGKPHVVSEYLPETVHNLETLLQQAERYGCRRGVVEALALLRQRVSRRADKGHSLGLIFVILVARRPLNLIGTSSPLELVPYLVDREAIVGELSAQETPVYPVAIHAAASSELLARMSGVPLPAERKTHIQLGAGSLGSKIALHLARAGLAPSAIIDKACLSPHNAARHALTLPRDPYGLDWAWPKANQLAGAITGLGQESQPWMADAVDWAGDHAQARKYVPKSTTLLVNSTAALSVREALASLPVDVMRARVVETSLFSGGCVGIMTAEGEERNPGTADLMYEAYAIAREQADLHSALFTGNGQVARQEIGQGCGSATMVVSDARISLHAAPMAEKLLAWLTDKLQPTGVIITANVPPSGFGLTWHEHAVGPFQAIRADNDRTWQIRISPRAHEKIVEEFQRYEKVETGGALIGVVSETRRAVTVIDVVPAPEDSAREPARFVLGTHGLAPALEEYANSTGHALYCIGTWHSHLTPSGPSEMDYATAREMSARTGAQSVALIVTSVGYRGLVQQHI